MFKTILQLFKYIKVERKYWLYPLILFLIILGVLAIAGESSVIAPFIYSFF